MKNMNNIIALYFLLATLSVGCGTAEELGHSSQAAIGSTRTVDSTKVDDSSIDRATTQATDDDDLLTATPKFDDGIMRDLGREDDPDNCIEWGNITYKNTIKEIMNKYCTKCHSSLHDPSGNPDGFAVSPKSPALNTFASIGGSGVPGWLYGKISAGEMPPPQSEEPMETADIKRFEVWKDRAEDELEGSDIPEISISSAQARRGYFRVRYTATDSDSTDAKVALFYDTNDSGFNGTVFKGCQPLSDSARRVIWNTSGLDAGRYYIYACVFDGDNATCNYAPNSVLIP